MSALARYFQAMGIDVAGYDRSETRLTKKLIKEGIPVHYTEDVRLIPKDTDLVIYTPAIPVDNQEFVFVNHAGYPVKKRSEVLGMITENYVTVAVAGTHGKTTITSMIAHILKSDRRNVTAFIGGITKDYQTNIIISENTEIMVVEADEYDRSFLQVHPDVMVISSIDPDHLDIYKSKKRLYDSFLLFINRLSKDGVLIINSDVKINLPLAIKQSTYSISGDADYKITDIHKNRGKYRFNIVHHDKIIEHIESGIPGMFNVENALAAAAVCMQLGVKDESIREALKSYRGVERRFDLRIDNPQLIYIDDYAHHPEEINACISAIKDLYPGKKITGVFQPHLYSRTRDLAEDFARSLEKLDTILLLDIYPAREKPIQGVDSSMLLGMINHPDKLLCNKKELLELISDRKIEIFLTMGAGDIDQLVNKIEQILNNNHLKPEETG